MRNIYDIAFYGALLLFVVFSATCLMASESYKSKDRHEELSNALQVDCFVSPDIANLSVEELEDAIEAGSNKITCMNFFTLDHETGVVKYTGSYRSMDK